MAEDSVNGGEAPSIFSRAFPPISRHVLALYSGVSGDSNPVHVDLDFARAAGFSDVFAHGMLVMAYLGVTLEERGPAEGIRHFSARFVGITQLHAQITCRARIAAVSDDDLTLELVAVDEAGDEKLRGRAIVDRASWGTSIEKA